jgi:hypothetical protein
VPGPGLQDPSQPLAWRFDPADLSRRADALAERYRAAVPFPSIVVDGLFPDALLARVADELPGADDPRWFRHLERSQRKLQWRDPAVLPPAAGHVLDLLQSAAFLGFLERLTGISGLIPDPHFVQGGVHLVESGGYLKVHTDQTYQADLWLNRRLNLITYLNRDWPPEWGGRLELWDDALARCVTPIEPLFNRTVIFSSAPPSNHGHPDPLACPPSVVRRSLAAYYYTSPANPGSPGTPPTADQFRSRPGRRFELLGHDARRFVIEELTPPIVVRKLEQFRHRRDG